jgi:serine/threonine protein kinase/WD40 repeat protein
MGSVYLATDPTVGQQVAVKLIRTELDGYADSAAAQVALERFRQEARAVAGLDHIHILPLNRYGEEQTAQGPRAYMIMQYRPEGSLWDWLRRRADFASGQLQPTQAERSSGLPLNWPLGLEEATDYLQQAASALQYAHDRSIVHRDIKPANFLLRFDQHEKRAFLLLGDFGLAKVFTGSSSTQTILGTPTYMAPEQFEGAARPESDQYALAVMIYYLLAGRPPFEGDPMQLMRQHMVAPVPSITQINPRVPPVVNGVLVRALSKKPEQRFASIATFAETFANVARQALSGQAAGLPSSYATAATVREVPGQARSSTPGFPPVSPVPQGPLVLPGQPERAYNVPGSQMGYPTPTPTAAPRPMGGMYGAQNQFGHAPNDVYAQQVFSPPQYQQYPNYQQQNGGKVGRRSALGWMLGGAALLIAGGGAGVYWYMNNGQQASGSGSSPILHVLQGHTSSVTSLSWLPDGSQLASGSLDQTARIWSSTDGKAIKTIQTGSAVNALAWSPDGATLATGEDNRSVALWKASGAAIKRETGWGAAVKCLAWRSDGNLLFMGTDGDGLHALQISNYKHYGHTTGLVVVNAIARSPDDALMALALNSGRVYFADLKRDWADVGSIAPEHGAALSIAWSPDKSLVVVGYADGKAVIYEATSRKVLYLLKHNGAVNSVAWKPDASAASPILVSGCADGTVNIWNPGQNQQTVYTGHTDAVLSVSWYQNTLASSSKDKSVILWQPPSF